MNIDSKKLGEAVKSIRLKRGMTQVELARAAGMAGNSIAILERGQRGFTVKNLNAIAKALKIPASCLTVLGSLDPGKKDPLASELLTRTRELIMGMVQVESKRQPLKRPARKAI